MAKTRLPLDKDLLPPPNGYRLFKKGENVCGHLAVCPRCVGESWYITTRVIGFPYDERCTSAAYATPVVNEQTEW